jgi:transmembrane 9 superfamily protein 2/4
VGWETESAAACNDVFISPRYRNTNYPGPLYLNDLEDKKNPKPVVWSYSVSWVQSDVKWGSRWDAYLSTSFADGTASIHWTYIGISMLLSLVISALVTFILLRTLHIECNKINSDDPEERQEEVGWKYVHADVFREPDNLHLLAIFVGNGVQLTITLFVTLVIGLFGFLAPANRGALLTCALLMFVLASFPAGYACAVMQKMFDKKEWRTIFGCALLFPGEIFFAWLFQDLMSAAMGASNSVNFGTFFGLLVLWLLISVPLTVLGSSFAWGQEKISFPVSVGKMAREIPLQRWYHTTPFVYFGPGFVPFMIIFLELRFILSSIWMGYVYYVFGFLTITILLWSYASALTAITMCYYQLAYEDWRWWWRSVLVPSGSGVWLAGYAVYFYFDSLNVKSAAGTVLYFTYSGLLTCAYVLVSGSIGFVACLLFTRKIYGEIRIE